MPSLRSRIVAAAVVALDVAGKPAGVEISRYVTTQQRAERRITIYRLNRQAERSHQSEFGPVQVNRMILRCRLDSLNRAGPADDAVDDLYVWCVRRLMHEQALANLGVARVSDIGDEPAAETYDQTYVREYVDFLVEFDTDLGDPAALPGESEET